MRRTLGFVALGAFIACVFVSNYAVQHWGTVLAPGGPHTITIGNLTAPSGVLVVGASFTFRDLAQRALGRWWVLGAIVVGAALSYLVAPSLAIASAIAFGVSESFDFAVYTPLAESGRWLAGVALSNTVGSFVDSVVFLWLAFHSLEFLAGQFWLKLLMTVPALIILTPWRVREILARRASA
jgi:queuosine precursor transporter